MIKRSSLTTNALVLYAAWQLVGIIATLAPSLLLIYLAGMIVMVVMLIDDFRTLATHQEFSASVSGPAVPELGTTITLHYAVAPLSKRAAGARKLELRRPNSELLAVPPALRELNRTVGPDGVSFRLDLDAGTEALGYETISAVELVQTSRQKFWRRSTQVSCAAHEFRVTPPSRKIPEQVYRELVAHQRILFQGSRLVMKTRAADQFYSIRKYQYPDSLRHIDQKKTAKYGQLMTRTYESMHNHHLVLALDTGRSMYGTINRSAKQDYYVSACLHLARNALQSGDRVSLLAFSQKAHLQIARARTLAAFKPMYRGETVLRAREEDSDYSLLNRMIPHLSTQRCILVILTDPSHPYVQQSLLNHLAPLCRTHLTAVVSLLDDRFDVSHLVRTMPDDARIDDNRFSTLLYGYWLQEQLQLFRNKLNRFGGAAVTVPDRYWLSTVGKVYETLRTSLGA